MTKHALVFAGRNGLDFLELRMRAMRIPEVSLRLREAQEIIDADKNFPLESMSFGPGQQIDLFTVIAGDDDFFFRDIQLKSLITAIVQVGLFDRYRKTQKASLLKPHFMVGNADGDSAMMVCSGLMTFREMVARSKAVDCQRLPVEEPIPFAKSLPPATLVVAPLLSGLHLMSYQVLEAQLNEAHVEYRAFQQTSMDLRKLVSDLFYDQGVARFINIGPALALRNCDYRSISDGEIEAHDSLELDPYLNWFWRDIRFQSTAMAN